MSFLVTAQKIKAVLDTVNAANVAVKYEYLETMPSTLPAGMVILQGGPPDRAADTTNNEVTMQFIVRTILPLEESQAAFEKALTVLDAIADEFRKESNLTLNGTVHRCWIDGYRSYASDQYTTPAVVLDIGLTVKQLRSTQ